MTMVLIFILIVEDIPEILPKHQQCLGSSEMCIMNLPVSKDKQHVWSLNAESTEVTI